MMWQPDHSRAIVKREELRLERALHGEAEAEEHASELDADEVARRAERKRLEREAAPHEPEAGDR